MFLFWGMNINPIYFVDACDCSDFGVASITSSTYSVAKGAVASTPGSTLVTRLDPPKRYGYSRPPQSPLYTTHGTWECPNCSGPTLPTERVNRRNLAKMFGSYLANLKSGNSTPIAKSSCISLTKCNHYRLSKNFWAWDYLSTIFLLDHVFVFFFLAESSSAAGSFASKPILSK